MIAPMAAAADDGNPPGLVKQRPEKGRYVETKQGFMVPYRQTIPGTDFTFEMVPVSGGMGALGSPADERGRRPDEGPQFELVLEPYWIGRYEVTWDEYQEYMNLRRVFRRFRDLGLRKVTEKNGDAIVTAPSAVYVDRQEMATAGGARPGRHPAVSMTQFAARQYTEWLSRLTGDFYRLPSEAEWEFACRAGSTTAYSFGDDPGLLKEYGWYHPISGEHTHPVGGKKPNAWGLYDMHGNAAEWVLDEYDARGYGRLKKLVGKATPLVAWPEQEFSRVVRGGSWDSDPVDCRSAARRASSKRWKEMDPSLPTSPWWMAGGAWIEVGFRIARPLSAPPEKERLRYWDADVESVRDTLKQYMEHQSDSAGLVDPDLPKALEDLED